MVMITTAIAIMTKSATIFVQPDLTFGRVVRDRGSATGPF